MFPGLLSPYLHLLLSSSSTSFLMFFCPLLHHLFFHLVYFSGHHSGSSSSSISLSPLPPPLLNQPSQCPLSSPPQILSVVFIISSCLAAPSLTSSVNCFHHFSSALMSKPSQPCLSDFISKPINLCSSLWRSGMQGWERFNHVYICVTTKKSLVLLMLDGG